MAHIRIDYSGDKYRFSIADDQWVCSDGPMQEIFALSLNQDLPFPRYISPVNPDPENQAIRDATLWLKERSINILTVAYNSPDDESYNPKKKYPIN